MPRLLVSLSTEEAGALARGGALAAVPFGSLEQHCNAPLGADGIIAERLAWISCSILEEKGGPQCVILPTLWYGYSPEWTAYEGTISLDLEVFTSSIYNIAQSLRKARFRNLAVINGHGGNTTPLEAIAREISAKLGLDIILVDYWRTAGIKLGHCDTIEEGLLSEILGKNIACRCEEYYEPVTRARLLRVPQKPEKLLGLKGGQMRPKLKCVAESIADAILEALNYHRGLSL